MKTKSFQEYLEKRLSKAEIAEIELQAKFEKEALVALQKDITQAIDSYMKKENIGFNELVRRLDISPTQLAKIQRGEANITLATIAHIFALFKKRPHLVFT
jgi:transcriptional regulator with XRE-family HTH domain